VPDRTRRAMFVLLITAVCFNGLLFVVRVRRNRTVIVSS
jgi:hypothetical protein